jgi:hypothetical protein
MKSVIASGAFKPVLGILESKGDATTRVARAIIDGEAASRVAQMERLKAARQAQESAAEPMAPAASTTGPSVGRKNARRKTP